MWCVAVSYNFDLEFHAYICETKKEAERVFRDIYDRTVQTEMKESTHGLDMDKTSIDEVFGYAVITWNNGDDGDWQQDKMEINLCEMETYRTPVLD